MPFVGPNTDIRTMSRKWGKKAILNWFDQHYLTSAVHFPPTSSIKILSEKHFHKCRESNLGQLFLEAKIPTVVLCCISMALMTFISQNSEWVLKVTLKINLAPCDSSITASIDYCIWIVVVMIYPGNYLNSKPNHFIFQLKDSFDSTEPQKYTERIFSRSNDPVFPLLWGNFVPGKAILDAKCVDWFLIMTRPTDISFELSKKSQKIPTHDGWSCLASC